MGEYENEKLNMPHEVAVRQYVADQLDPLVGRAEVRFRAYLAQGQPVSRSPSRFGNWTAGVLGTALAACVAVMWASSAFQRQVAPVDQQATPLGKPAIRSEEPPMFISQDLTSRTFDEGVSLLDGRTPVRVLRRRDLQRTRWFDQDEKLQGEKIVPEDHVVYVQLKTY